MSKLHTLREYSILRDAITEDDDDDDDDLFKTNELRFYSAADLHLRFCILNLIFSQCG